MKNLKKIIISAIFISLIVIFTKVFYIQLPFIRISLSFIPTIFMTLILGPIWGFTVAGLGDIVGAYLLPAGPFFPGFTLSACLTGLIYGIFLYHKNEKKFFIKNFLAKLCISNIIVKLLIDGVLTTLWVSIFYGKAFWIIIPTRITIQLILLPVQIITIYAMHKLLKKFIYKFTSNL